MKRTLSDIAYEMQNAKVKDIPVLWKEYHSKALSRLGFNKQSREQLFSWGENGHNWKKLHIGNSSYAGKDNIRKLLREDFLEDVLYIFDRISLDRLFRCHWLFNHGYIIPTKWLKVW